MGEPRRDQSSNQCQVFGVGVIRVLGRDIAALELHIERRLPKARQFSTNSAGDVAPLMMTIQKNPCFLEIASLQRINDGHIASHSLQMNHQKDGRDGCQHEACDLGKYDRPQGQALNTLAGLELHTPARFAVHPREPPEVAKIQPHQWPLSTQLHSPSPATKLQRPRRGSDCGSNPHCRRAIAHLSTPPVEGPVPSEVPQDETACAVAVVWPSQTRSPNHMTPPWVGSSN